MMTDIKDLKNEIAKINKELNCLQCNKNDNNNEIINKLKNKLDKLLYNYYKGYWRQNADCVS